MGKKTVVIGASDNPDRVSNQAVINLNRKGHEVIPVGIKDGMIDGMAIIKGRPAVIDVDTVTLYIGPKNQPEWYEYIISLNPKRVVFNPGTENPEFAELLQKNNIETEEACTLVLLSVGNY
ncbi:MAG: CoA-binding protein [Bacteroidetes bacterium]|nr:CoA-binding protein [Bacteroidota bacterium]